MIDIFCTLESTKLETIILKGNNKNKQTKNQPELVNPKCVMHNSFPCSKGLTTGKNERVDLLHAPAILKFIVKKQIIFPIIL